MFQRIVHILHNHKKANNYQHQFGWSDARRLERHHGGVNPKNIKSTEYEGVKAHSPLQRPLQGDPQKKNYQQQLLDKRKGG